MANTRWLPMASVSLVVLAVLFAVSNARPVVAQKPETAGSAPVHIVGPLPLPVTGTTTVEGNVTVTEPVSVRNLDEAGRSPYQETGFVTTTQAFNIITFSQVPAGKRLVIQRVSALLPSKAGVAIVDFYLTAHLNGSLSTTHFLE